MSVPFLLDRLSRNLASVRERITQAARRVGRSGSEVELVAVTKYSSWPAILGLLDLGHLSLGENRPQQLLEREIQAATERPDLSPRWHLIGQLQRNKVRSVLPATCLIHSIDSLRLLERVHQVGEELGITPRVLLQVNISGEDSKSGFAPNDVRACLEQASQWTGIEIDGLMTMAPLTEEESLIRPVFRGLRELRDQLATSRFPLPQLSMGMSGDFEIAIEEGATLVRVGSALFEGCEAAS